jgi:hypothetical protein
MHDPSPAEIEARCHLIRDARCARLASGKPWTEANVAAVAEAWADSPLVDDCIAQNPPCVQQRIWEALADGPLTLRQLASRIGTTRSSVTSALGNARWCYTVEKWRWQRARRARGTTTPAAVIRHLRLRGSATEKQIGKALCVPPYAVRAAINKSAGMFRRTGGNCRWALREKS